MSTKAIRKALKYLKDNDLDEELAAATAEVEAIERAADVLDTQLPGRYSMDNPGDVIHALNVMSIIARDAP